MKKDINECTSKPKIILICFNFGKLSDYFSLWLKSIEKKHTVDFILFTDDKTIYNYPKNLAVDYYTFEYTKEFTQSKFDFNILIDRPYKFCDYRPAFGYIFYEKIKAYDFWGTCDLDVIFGNIHSFITYDILCSYDKILTRDHFVIYRNDPIIADRDVKWFNFKVTSDQNHKNPHQIFAWHKDGKLLRYFTNLEGLIQSEEFMYIHLKKRKMKIESSSYDSFLIVPNKFVDFDPEKVNKKIIRKYRQWRPLYYLKHLLIRNNNYRYGYIY